MMCVGLLFGRDATDSSIFMSCKQSATLIFDSHDVSRSPTEGWNDSLEEEDNRIGTSTKKENIKEIQHSR
jgi:hypothetical protein